MIIISIIINVCNEIEMKIDIIEVLLIIMILMCNDIIN